MAKVLYLDGNLRFIDPTRQILPLVYLGAAETVFYGPGHVSGDVLARGVEAFVDAHGPFDVVVTNELVLQYPELPENMLRSHHRAFPREHLRYWGDLRQYFARHRGAKIVNLLQSDFYNFRAKHIDPLRDTDALCISYNHQIIAPLEAMPALRHEGFAGSANDNFHRLVSAAPDRFVPLITCMMDAEFWFAPVADRPQRWSVPGAPYYGRGEARQALAAAGERGRRRLSPFSVFAALDRIGVKPFSSRIGLQLYNALFNEDLEQTRYVYTCGSALGYPIRKFFEIPAHGCVLVCVPFFGAEAFGFVDGESMVVAEPGELPELGVRLDRERERTQAIADAGRMLVWERHSVAARSRQLRAVLEAVTAGTFRRAVWERGEFQVWTEDGIAAVAPGAA